MMAEDQSAAAAGVHGHAFGTAGEALRAARESAGLSVDAVAQHLKLAPRQIRALEAGAWGELPGPTFVRGFARNYARLFDLDGDAIVAALPEAISAPSHDKVATARAIGELPATERARRGSWSRWLIPLLLIALIGAAAWYELSRRAVTPIPGERPAAARPVPLDPVGPPGLAVTPLPNPIAAAGSPAQSPPVPQSAGDPSTPPLPITTAPAVQPPLQDLPILVISYQGPAWTEVRDANGQRLLVTTGTAGASETVSGTPPFELTLGNASQATVRWRGEPFDLGPHVKGNVARVRLP